MKAGSEGGKKPNRRRNEMNTLPELFRRGMPWLSEMERMIGDYSARAPAMPNYEVMETERHYVMELDLPGVRKEDVQVKMRDGHLVVSGERREQRGGTGQRPRERYFGKFSRSFSVPGVRPDQVEAEFRDGVLRIAVPKAEGIRAQAIPVADGKSGLMERILGPKTAEPATQPDSQATHRVA
jgi:HSP20 family protein